MEKIFGKNLKNPDNDEFPLSKLEDIPFTLIYFSASFCPPSQYFTKLLLRFY
jgi:hypothetical protein